jgi:hypothetical protein
MGLGRQSSTAYPGRAEQRRTTDCLQRALRSRFRQQFRPGVDMTSDVKSWEPLFLGFHQVFCPAGIGRGGARKTRRVLLLLSVG